MIVRLHRHQLLVQAGRPASAWRSLACRSGFCPLLARPRAYAMPKLKPAAVLLVWWPHIMPCPPLCHLQPTALLPYCHRSPQYSCLLCHSLLPAAQPARCNPPPPPPPPTHPPPPTPPPHTHTPPACLPAVQRAPHRPCQGPAEGGLGLQDQPQRPHPSHRQAVAGGSSCP